MRRTIFRPTSRSISAGRASKWASIIARSKAAGNDANTPAGNFAFKGIFTKSAPTSAGTGGADVADMLLGYPDSGSEYTSTKLTDFVNYYGIIHSGRIPHHQRS